MKDNKESSYLQEENRCTLRDRAICPFCGKTIHTIKNGFRDRTYIDKDSGECLSIAVQKWFCTKCNKYFTELPNFLVPYKRYMKKEIENVVKNFLKHDKVSYLFCTVVSVKQQYVWVNQFLINLMKLSFPPPTLKYVGVSMY